MVKFALIAGGRSGEFDVSIKSSEAVAAALHRLGHDICELIITREGTARFNGEEMPLARGFDQLSRHKVDCAFIAMHGEDGEDGRIQGVLDLLGIPYQGCGVTASAAAMSKSIAKLHYRACDLPVADDVTLRPADVPIDWHRIADSLSLPLVLKTATSGSSVGVEVVDTLDDLVARGDALLSTTSALVVERWLLDGEFTAAVLEEEDGSLTALPIVEIDQHPHDSLITRLNTPPVQLTKCARLRYRTL